MPAPVLSPDTPITRDEAKAKRQDFYFTGKPCAEGHFAWRKTSNRHCTACHAPWDKSVLVDMSALPTKLAYRLGIRASHRSKGQYVDYEQLTLGARRSMALKTARLTANDLREAMVNALAKPPGSRTPLEIDMLQKVQAAHDAVRRYMQRTGRELTVNPVAERLRKSMLEAVQADLDSIFNPVGPAHVEIQANGQTVVKDDRMVPAAQGAVMSGFILPDDDGVD